MSLSMLAMWKNMSILGNIVSSKYLQISVKYLSKVDSDLARYAAVVRGLNPWLFSMLMAAPHSTAMSNMFMLSYTTMMWVTVQPFVSYVDIVNFRLNKIALQAPAGQNCPLWPK